MDSLTDKLPQVLSDTLESGGDVLSDNLPDTSSFGSVDYGVLAAGLLVGILLLARRTNVALAIFGLCVGYFFQALIADELILSLSAADIEAGSFTIRHLVNMFLVFTPALLIIWRFRGYQKDRLLSQFIPAIAFAALLALLLLEVLPYAISDDIRSQSFVLEWIYSNQFWAALVTVMIALLDIILLEAQRSRSHKRIKKHQSRLFRR